MWQFLTSWSIQISVFKALPLSLFLITYNLQLAQYLAMRVNTKSVSVNENISRMVLVNNFLNSQLIFLQLYVIMQRSYVFSSLFLRDELKYWSSVTFEWMRWEKDGDAGRIFVPVPEFSVLCPLDSPAQFILMFNCIFLMILSCPILFYLLEYCQFRSSLRIIEI